MKATDSPWNLSVKTDKFLFDWYDLPENAMRKTRFSFAMACSINLGIRVGYPSPRCSHRRYRRGVGSTALQIAKATPHVKTVMQDRASVIEDAATYWERSAPDLLNGGNVKFEGHYMDQATGCIPPKELGDNGPLAI
ncbi:hypothetical protein B0H13DRAFT_1860242 [Mycena leptocephala]|nr:hypothetical protein B0H13DRAFT_1860242 [Mycena leptocephala]